MRALVIAVVLITPVLAGCLAADNGAPGAGSEPATVPEPWAIPFSVTDCTVVGASVSFDIERARAFVPPGYEPHEGGNLFGFNEGEHAPAPVAALNLQGMDCPHHDATGGAASWFHAAIDIRPPKVANTTSPSPHDVYDVQYLTPDGPVLELLGRGGLPVADAEVVQEVTVLEGAATGSLRVTDARGDLLRLEVSGAGPQVFEGTAAFWHQNEDGLSLTHLDGLPGLRVWVGPVVACELAEGSLLADLVGSTDCGGRATVGAVGTDYSIDFTLTYMPGAQAEVAG